ncbi:uncharacterized protein LOC131435817 [Malaya genurostris]|uniref:uncharacterized protein LOC131435817 n=1 Tax=Malaya genurostris TaxID=325434 RepID=UPI0026F3E233|nr:uncharacterized protein LOC131435817 [Malaya genurostris]
MFNFFKRSKSQKSKHKHEQKLQLPKHDGNASQLAASSACVAHTLETQSPTTTVQQYAHEGNHDRDNAAVYLTGGPHGRGTESGSIKNKQHSAPTAINFSPSDIIHGNGCSFGYENGIAIEFADEESDADGNAINECVQREISLPFQVRGEANGSTFQRSSSYRQNAALFESDMAKGRNKRRYQQQQQGKNLNNQQGQQHQTVNKDGHLLPKQTGNILEKQDKENVGKLGAAMSTENEVLQLDDKVFSNECNSNEDQGGKIVGSYADFQQQSYLMVDDVGGETAEDRDDKNSVVVLSLINKTSSTDRSDLNGSVSAVVENSTESAQSVTSPFPLTQTTVNGTPTDVERNEVLSSIHDSLVSQQYHEVEIYTSATTDINDDQSELVGSEIVTTEDVTSIKEMGQQPSKTSDSTNRSKRSGTPIHQPTLIVPSTPQNLTAQMKTDTFRDDTSDDKDIFYEAESVTPTSPLSSTCSGERYDKIIPSLSLIDDHNSNQSEPRTCPKKRVVFSDQLVIDGNPLSENEFRNDSSDDNKSTESINLESLAKNNDEHMHTVFPPGSTVNNKICENVVFSVNNERSAFNSDNSSILVNGPVDNSKHKIIDFRYDSSDTKNVNEKYDKTNQECEDNMKITSQITENEPSLIVEDIVSLPDVVQPTSIEKVTKQPFNTVDKINSEMKELVNQESRYSAKLEDAEKRASEAQIKVYELQQRLDDVKRDVSLKECNVERKLNSASFLIGNHASDEVPSLTTRL